MTKSFGSVHSEQLPFRTFIRGGDSFDVEPEKKIADMATQQLSL
jgi:hypothetical protein